MNPTLATLLAASGGALRRSDHRELRHVLDAALAGGVLVAPFRGVYTVPDADHSARLRALALADPDAVATGPSAEHLHGWAAEAPADVDAASRLQSRPGFRLTRRTIPRRLTTTAGGVRCATRALTAIDLATQRGVDEVDAALRRRIPLKKLWDAYLGTPNRRGRRRVAQWLTDSRTTPWSPLERQAHAALHDAGVRGWVANLSVALDADVATAFVDMAFRALRLAIEVDGWQWHQSRSAFDRDRLRDVRLAELGWMIVRFPGAWVLAHPAEFAASVRRILAARAASLG